MTSRTIRGALGILGLVALGAAGCGDDAGTPATRAEIERRLPPMVASLVDRSAQSLDGVVQSQAWTNLRDAIGSLDGEAAVMGGSALTAAETGMRRAYIEHVMTTSLGDERTPGDRIAELLLEDFFTDEEGNGIWRLRGDRLCPRLQGGAQSLASCIRMVDEMEVRLRVTLAGASGLDVALLVGPARDEVFAIELRPESIKVTFDLGALRGAIAHIGDVLGEAVALPEVLEGRVSFLLRVDGPDEVTFEVAIERAIVVRGSSPTDGDFALDLEARTPLFRVHARGGAMAALDVGLDWGRTRVSVPVRFGVGGAGRLAIDAGGLGGRLELDAGVGQVHLADLGLGARTTEVVLDDERLVAIDLNAASDRKLSATITPNAMRRPQIAIEPGLDLVVDVHLQPLVDRGESVATYLRNETYSLSATGQPRFEQVRRPADLARLLAVLAGRLTLASTAAPSPTVVEAGRCLFGSDAVAPGEHPLLGRFLAVDCD
jgi:hypothetical protein